jgi:GT2 family glycosyltransferase
MRLSFALGRRYPEYDFFLAVRGKKEQFRARNSIVEEALRAGCDYLFFLDDDQIIDIDNSMLPSSRYLFLKRLIQHMDNDPAMGICGALYYQRDATDCWPVVMQVNRGGHGYSFLTHPEITGGLQRVAVTGGGAMLIRASVFDKIEHPWFRPELDFGTDIQICQKVQEAGFTVWCDTSVEIGHTRAEREVVCYKTVRKLMSAKGESNAAA